jgi:hypothetical protein
LLKLRSNKYFLAEAVGFILPYGGLLENRLKAPKKAPKKFCTWLTRALAEKYQGVK